MFIIFLFTYLCVNLFIYFEKPTYVHEICIGIDLIVFCVIIYWYIKIHKKS